MTKPRILGSAASGNIGLPAAALPPAAAENVGAPSAQAWFARGERIGYDPKPRAIVAAQDAPLHVFLRREGDLAQAVSFLAGFRRPIDDIGRLRYRLARRLGAPSAAA